MLLRVLSVNKVEVEDLIGVAITIKNKIKQNEISLFMEPQVSQCVSLFINQKFGFVLTPCDAPVMAQTSAGRLPSPFSTFHSYSK